MPEELPIALAGFKKRYEPFKEKDFTPNVKVENLPGKDAFSVLKALVRDLYEAAHETLRNEELRRQVLAEKKSIYAMIDFAKREVESGLQRHDSLKEMFRPAEYPVLEVGRNRSRVSHDAFSRAASMVFVGGGKAGSVVLLQAKAKQVSALKAEIFELVAGKKLVVSRQIT